MNEDRINEFIDIYIDSFLSWELIILFHSNPGIKDDIKGISRLLARKPENIQLALDVMCSKGLTCSEYIYERQVYYFNPPEELKQMINLFISSLDTYDNRIKYINRILNKTNK